MAGEDVEYYRQRAETERSFAKNADRANVAAIHAELARQYQALVDREDLRPFCASVFRRRVLHKRTRFRVSDLAIGVVNRQQQLRKARGFLGWPKAMERRAKHANVALRQ